MTDPEIFRAPLSVNRIERLAQDEFGDMIKFVVDLKRKIMAAGGGLHSDEELLLLQDGSEQSDLWGGNYYWQDRSESRLEYTSMINLRPSDGNPSQEVQSEALRRSVREIALHYFESAR